MTPLTQLTAWRALQQHHQTIANQSMQDWFAQDPLRFSQFSLTLGDILFDFSKNRITTETLTLLAKLAQEAQLSAHIKALFSGDVINSTENRPALHTALRDRQTKNLVVNGRNIMADIHAELQKMQQFTEQVRNGTWRGATDKPIQDIVNIGIGGSHLGPQMVTQALSDFVIPERHCYFVSNMDGAHVQDVLRKINPETTLFIISSKSFTTIETLSNAAIIQNWLREKLNVQDVSAHFVTVTAASDKAKKWGLPDTQIFRFWDWVGGRYSIWSAIGLPVALLIGMEKFYEFLDGAHAVDMHFQQSDFTQNIPALMGLIGLWYINFFGCTEHVIASYAHELNFLADYIQQADMESNGKTINRFAVAVDHATGPVVFGQQGCDSQHSFFQLIHQGPRLIPLDFVVIAVGNHFQELQDGLVASALSQAQALMVGRTLAESLAETQQSEQLAKHKMIPGNRPSNTFFIKKITPYNLGMLIALYEHKIFTQGVLWQINSFDQWGVELGKKLLPPILANMQESRLRDSHSLDSSTEGLIQYYLQARGKA